jgi:5-carboxymethyl-2-hydroxymuconate isomerase
VGNHSCYGKPLKQCGFLPRQADIRRVTGASSVKFFYIPAKARNALARAVCFHRLGRLRDRATEAQQYRASGLAIVTAAIALLNTVYLGRALDDLRRRGEIIPDPLLAHLAPVGWQHINLTGDYLWDADTHLAPDGFRQLRAPAGITAHAA